MTRIFVTGITGTIGRAFVELLKDQYHLVGVDRNESAIAQFKHDYPKIDVSVGDFGDVNFVNNGMDLLIHLAAMKHVDLCETNASECVNNNVIKTHRLFQSAYNNGVGILFMSTDKAVEPISVYGYSKALGESMALEYGGAIVRSGNVVNSNGSVTTVWDDAIKQGSTLKLTHKDMRRYFIGADSLVSQAWYQYLDGKKVIIPKMDKEIGLMELLEDRLAEFGYTLENYPGEIEYIGLRAGEKLAEKLDWG